MTDKINSSNQANITKQQATSTYFGFVGIIGRPNVGKSTLLNSLLPKKLVITSKKAQTTRHNILGIRTQGNRQTVYVDTPGFRDATKKLFHKYLNKAASQTVHDVDLLIWVVDAAQWTSSDDAVLALVQHANKPVILVVNKVDQVKPKTELLPILAKLEQKYGFISVIPISALKQDNISALEQAIAEYLPTGEFHYAPDQLTDRDQAFIFAEIIREKLMRFLGQEVPYSSTVEIEKIEQDKTSKLYKINALIWVERVSQRAIVVGKQGASLKRIGSEARLALEAYLGQKVYLALWVKVKEDWSNDASMLQQFGYE